jgi:hypothetical protein
VAKIESIRPGGVFESNFREYPLAELLLGVLRGNLTGQLEVRISQDPRNWIYFKDGVPVSVDLPDCGVSVAKILNESGELSRERAVDVARAADKLRMSESKVIVESEILSHGAINDARRRRAREEVVRLFDAGPASFSFVEGRLIPEQAALTILQPLPILFEGLRRCRDRSMVDRFVEEHGHAQFKLSATYPIGVDPFEWGRELEAKITSLDEPKTITELSHLGLDKKLTEVAVAVMFWLGMVELHRNVAARRAPVEHVTPAGEPRGVRSPAPSEEREASGLVVHRRTSVAAERLPVQPITEPLNPAIDRVGAALSAYRGKSYYKILRVTESTAADQIERSYRHLLRLMEEQEDPAVRHAIEGVLDEAYATVADRDAGPRYRDLSERSKASSGAVAERQSIEAERKIGRALSTMAEGRLSEAHALLEWISLLDPTRRDLKILRGMLSYFRTPKDRRPLEARALKPLVLGELQRSPGDSHLKMCVALISAEEGEHIDVGAENASHPLMDRVRDLLRKH